MIDASIKIKGVYICLQALPFQKVLNTNAVRASARVLNRARELTLFRLIRKGINNIH